MKNDRRVLRTKRNIRKAFNQLILHKDLTAITITEVAHLADIDRKTFYLHYNSLEDILREFEDELADKVLFLLKKNKEIDISSFFTHLNQIMLEELDLYRRFSEATSYSFFLLRCKDILKNAIVQSFFPKSTMPLAAFQVYAEYLASGIIGIYTDWLRSDQKLTLTELTAIAEDAVYHGWEKIIE